jgi:hypothetical protein
VATISTSISENDAPPRARLLLEIGDRAAHARQPGEQLPGWRAQHLARLAPCEPLVFVQRRQPDRLQHQRNELPAQMPLLLALPGGRAGEQLAQERLRSGHTGFGHRALEARQEHGLDHGLKEVVAGDAEAFAEVLLRQDGLAVLGEVGCDHQVGGAAAHVDRGDAQARLLAVAAPDLALQREQQFRLGLQPPAALVVEPDELGRGRLVEIGDDLRLGRRARQAGARLEPAHQPPGEIHRRLGAALQDALLGERHRRRQRQHQPAQPSRYVDRAARGTMIGRVDLAERLHQQFGEHEGRERGAREAGAHAGAQPVADRLQHLALLGDVLHEGAADGRLGAAVGGGPVEAPDHRGRPRVPEIALGRGEPGGTLVAARRRGEADRLGADAHGAAPVEGERAAGFVAQRVTAEARAVELDPALERQLVRAVRCGELAQAEHGAVVEVERPVRVLLHQHAAGAAVAEIEHEIDIDRPVGQECGGDVDRLDARDQPGLVEGREEGEVARPVLGPPGQVLGTQPAAARGLARLAEIRLQPLVHPGLAEEPGVARRVGDQAEQHLLGRRRERGVDLSRHARGECRVEGERDRVGVAVPVGRGERAHADARPVGGAIFDLRGTGRVRVAHLEERQRRPAVEERLERARDVDLIVPG